MKKEYKVYYREECHMTATILAESPEEAERLANEDSDNLFDVYEDDRNITHVDGVEEV